MFADRGELKAYILSQLPREFVLERNIRPENIHNAINTAYSQLVRWGELLEDTYIKSSVDGTEYYSFEDKFFKIEDVWYDGYILTYQKKRPDNVGDGKPTHYRLEGVFGNESVLALYPIPDNTGDQIMVKAKMLPTSLTLDTSEPDLKEDYRIGIAVGALYYLTLGSKLNGAFAVEWYSLKDEYKRMALNPKSGKHSMQLEDGDDTSEVTEVYRY